MAATGEAKPLKLCGNCGQRPAIVSINGVPFCVNCYGVLQEAERTRIETFLEVQDQMARDINYLSGQIESSLGIGTGYVPRIAPKAPRVVQTGVVTQHINLQGSAIGVVNTGTIQNLDQTIGQLRAGGAEELAAALQTFIESAGNEANLSDDDKRELLEDVEVLLREVFTPEGKRKQGVIRTLVTRIGEIAGAVVTVADAWNRVLPILRQALPFL